MSFFVSAALRTTAVSTFAGAATTVGALEATVVTDPVGPTVEETADLVTVGIAGPSATMVVGERGWEIVYLGITTPGLFSMTVVSWATTAGG